ncbi:MAG: diguanylate cyclase [Gammaproteobacteria bacterium]
MGVNSPGQLQQKIEVLEREIALTRRFAYHDALTGLPNRALMLDRLEQSIAQARSKRKCVGVLLLNLDDFKRINDNLGLPLGNAILQQVATRLLGCLGGGDTACRYDGEQFVVLLPEIASAEDMEGVRQKIGLRVRTPHRLESRSVVLNVSIGSALFGQGAETGADLIGIADADRRRAKRASVAGGMPDTGRDFQRN